MHTHAHTPLYTLPRLLGRRAKAAAEYVPAYRMTLGLGFKDEGLIIRILVIEIAVDLTIRGSCLEDAACCCRQTRRTVDSSSLCPGRIFLGMVAA